MTKQELEKDMNAIFNTFFGDVMKMSEDVETNHGTKQSHTINKEVEEALDDANAFVKDLFNL